MKSSLLHLAAFFCLLWAVDKAVGVSIRSDGGTDMEYSDTDDYIVVDDMIIYRDESRAGFVNHAWPNGVVIYTYHSNITTPQRRNISQAMLRISRISCIRFRLATSQDRYNIRFVNNPKTPGCRAPVGWSNMRNMDVQLSPSCSLGNTVHELIHSLGFFHEHTRNDRDDYVRVNFNNIKGGEPIERNFKKNSERDPNSQYSYYGVPYNYDSIMHYGKTFFSKSPNLNTIDVLYNRNAIGNGDNIGQRTRISNGDTRMIRAKYNCPNDPPPASDTDIEEEAGEITTTEPTTQSTPTTRTSGTEAQTETTVQTTTQNNNPICRVQPNLPVCKRSGDDSK